MRKALLTGVRKLPDRVTYECGTCSITDASSLRNAGQSPKIHTLRMYGAYFARLRNE